MPPDAAERPGGPTEQPRYSAFISYSHADHACARWLHRSLETYRLPKQLVGSDSPFGAVLRRLLPVFRDRDELSASGDLGGALRAALAQSRFQIVVCSPASAQSHWVNEEILSFKRLHGEKRTLALILSGEPYAADARECFPPSLRFQIAPDGSLSVNPAEPIAADIRPGKDGRRLALLKLVAGLTGVPLAALARRDAARRQRRLVLVACVSLAIAVMTGGLAIYAEAQRRVAESQRRLADKSLEFLINTFAIANPATENPRTITAMTILDRASRRASTELIAEPAVSARLLQTTGDIYANLGLLKEADRDLRASLRLNANRSEGRAHALQRLAFLAITRGDLKEGEKLVEQAAQSYTRDASYASALDARGAELRGMIAYLQRRYQPAATLFGEAASSYQAARGGNPEALGAALMSEARALGQIRKFRSADRLLERALALYVANFGANSVLTGKALQNRAVNDFEGGRYARAEEGTKRTVAIYRKVFEENHPALASAYILLGRIQTARGDLANAAATLGSARKIYVKLYGAANPAVADVDFYAAEAASLDGSGEIALRLLDRVKTIYDASYGPDDPDQVELLSARARIFARTGRNAASTDACAAAMSLQARLDPDTAKVEAVRKECSAPSINPHSS